MKKERGTLVRFLRSSKLLDLLTGSSDILLALFIIVIIAVIIIPIPTGLLDNLIALNLTFSIALLMVALWIPKAVNLSIFPSLLLITTLFRLGIEISATKHILLYATAGHIIQTFGQFVVGGSFVVGGIVFLIITIVQFIVVTKGAERVAEVAARFNLDAMPGKQMSIDADLRSGIIDANKARDLRLFLAKESQLYGAMDGAINIIGGLIIGVMIHKMSALRSAQVYTLLSIGSGLVSQIPSLLIALTAGIVTTRVSSEKKEAPLGKEISTQILNQPKALLIAAFVMFCAMLIRGFPKLIFFVIASLMGTIGYFFYRRSKKESAKMLGISPAARMETEIEGHAVIRGAEEEYALTLPIILEVGRALSQTFKKEKGGQTFIDEMIPKMLLALYQDLGVRFPGVHVRTDSPTLEPDEYSILLNEVPIVRGKIIENSLLPQEREETLRRYNIPFTQSKTTLGPSSYWVSSKYEDLLKKAGIKYWRPSEGIVLHLSYFYQKNASEFIGIQEIRAILEFMEKSFPDLAKEVTRLVPLQKLTEIFKRLVQEEISIKDLRTILEALSEWAQTEKDTVLLTEYVRSSLKRYISYKYSQGQSILSVYLLDPEIEDMVRGAIKQTSAGSYLALDPDAVQLIIQALRNTITPTPAGGQPPVLLTAIDVRRFVRKLIESDFPDLPVISYQEVLPEIRIQPLGRVQLT